MAFIRILLQALVSVVLILLVLLAALWVTSPIDPAPLDLPPAQPLTGPLAPNQRLDGAERRMLTLGEGPEDIALATDGSIYGGLADGKIVRISPSGEEQIFADTGGRPLGLHFDRAGNLIVADGVKGLLSITPAGDITTLLTEVAGVPLGFADDVDIAPDGVIYFSDASSRYGFDELSYEALEGRPYGRLIAYDPATRRAKVLLHGLYFANGVAVSPDGRFVLVNETFTFRVRRYWLKGTRAGQDEVFIDRLPGYPDGIAAGADGDFWLALFTQRTREGDGLAAWPALRAIMAHFPDALEAAQPPYGFVIRLGPNGSIKASLQDTDGSHVPFVTSAQPVGNRLWLGSLVTPQIVNLPINQGDENE